VSFPRELVAIAVPVTDRPSLLPDEEVSFRHLVRHLGGYDRYLIAPKSATIRLQGCEVKTFGRRYFGSAEAHKKLLLSRHFYHAFEAYEFLLIYHLDALVFGDDLGEWCERGFDYIAAPWLVDRDDPMKGFSRVGNGGFSLRRVPSFLKVFDSKRRWSDPRDYWRTRVAQEPWSASLANLPRAIAKHVQFFNGARWQMRRWYKNEDFFWADRAEHYDPEFRVAPVEEGLRFAFECAPRYCYERNGGRLPFGCHAWPFYDRAFWEPHLLQDDRDVQETPPGGGAEGLERRQAVETAG